MESNCAHSKDYFSAVLKAQSGRKDFLPVEAQGSLSFLFRLSEPRFA
jgi:hypothetical protein